MRKRNLRDAAWPSKEAFVGVNRSRLLALPVVSNRRSLSWQIFVVTILRLKY